MSSLIVQNHGLFTYTHPPAQSPTHTNRKAPISHSLADRLSKYLQELLKDGPGEVISCREGSGSLQVVVLHRGVVTPNVLLQKLTFDRGSGSWRNRLHPLDRCHSHIKIDNPDKLRFLWTSLLLRRDIPFKLSINSLNGSVAIALPSLLPALSPAHARPFDLADQLRKTIKITFELFKHSSKYYHVLWEFYDLCDQRVAGSRRREPAMGFRKCMGQFGVELWLGGEGQAEQQLVAGEEIEKQSRRRIVQRQVALAREERNSLELYVDCSKEQSFRAQEGGLYLSFQQRQEMRRKLKLPFQSQQAIPNPNDNNYILNCIKFNDYSHLQLQPLTESNFSTIYVTRSLANFWYVYSGNSNEVVASEESFTRDKLIRKPIVVKREKASKRNRVEHEKNILKQIKGGKAVFIPQYYLSTVENELKEDLLSDFLWNELTLNLFAVMRRPSLSLATKVHVLLMVLQGVRYISLFGIVHLDLKPGNLMVSSSLGVKIIDFGESYHPAICNAASRYSPGFSPPYGAPEAFLPSERTAYSQKCDIFSIGVIAYEFLFGRVPFTFPLDDQPRIYGSKEYVDHFFYVPEELCGYGDGEVFPLLQLAIARCLDPDPSKRPGLDWLCLVLRECSCHYRM